MICDKNYHTLKKKYYHFNVLLIIYKNDYLPRFDDFLIYYQVSYQFE